MQEVREFDRPEVSGCGPDHRGIVAAVAGERGPDGDAAALSQAGQRATERGVRVVPYEAIIPRGVTPAESTRLNQRLMSNLRTPT